MVATIAFNVWINLRALPRFGVRVEVVRVVTNSCVSVIVGGLTGWPTPCWLWPPYIALAFDQSGGIYADLAGAHAQTRAALDQLTQEIATRERVELELRAAQKLEAIGRIAAGVAHEINTPIQFVGDNLRLLRDGIAEILGLRELDAAARRVPDDARAEAIAAVAAAAEAADVGYPPAARDYVFEPFFTTKEVGRGTGQGLAIARAIVERHHGRLTFDTELGCGTTFHVRLPIQVAD